MTPRLEIVVDELVVRGLAPEAARAAAAQLEDRLTGLAGAHAVVSARHEHVRRIPSVDARADGVGEAVASAVWHAISGRAR
jgi:hypothetical protein